VFSRDVSRGEAKSFRVQDVGVMHDNFVQVTIVHHFTAGRAPIEMQLLLGRERIKIVTRHKNGFALSL